jgi:hypothetical protein
MAVFFLSLGRTENESSSLNIFLVKLKKKFSDIVSHKFSKLVVLVWALATTHKIVKPNAAIHFLIELELTSLLGLINRGIFIVTIAHYFSYQPSFPNLTLHSRCLTAWPCLRRGLWVDLAWNNVFILPSTQFTIHLYLAA